MDGDNTRHDTGGVAEEGPLRGGDSRHMDSWDNSRSLGKAAAGRSIEGARGDRAGRDGRGDDGRRHCLPFHWGSSYVLMSSRDEFKLIQMKVQAMLWRRHSVARKMKMREAAARGPFYSLP
jgi:hypothetical protein